MAKETELDSQIDHSLAQIKCLNSWLRDMTGEIDDIADQLERKMVTKSRRIEELERRDYEFGEEIRRLKSLMNLRRRIHGRRVEVLEGQIRDHERQNDNLLLEVESHQAEKQRELKARKAKGSDPSLTGWQFD